MKPRLALTLAIIVILFYPVPPAHAQEQDDPGCRSNKILASTDRPTYSTGTETTQCGVLEIIGGSYGFHSLNPATPAFAVSTADFDWQIAHKSYIGSSSTSSWTKVSPAPPPENVLVLASRTLRLISTNSSCDRLKRHSDHTYKTRSHRISNARWRTQ